MQDNINRIKIEFDISHPDFFYSSSVDGFYSSSGDGEYFFNVKGDYSGLDLSFMGIVGSQSHNTYVPKTDPDSIDDIDVMGVVPLPASHLFGLKTFEHWTLKKDDLDVVVYSLPKFVNLLLKGNPNVMGLLWLREEEQLQVPEWWNRLVLNRHMFASKKNVYDSFIGYAKGQMERMTSYTPEIDEEIQSLKGTLDGFEITHDQAMGDMPFNPLWDYNANLMKAVTRYKTLNQKFHFAYMGDKRKQLVRKHGYDSKNAAHMIRLLCMAKEYLKTGEMQVYRTDDAEILRSIKRGKWALDQVQFHANKLFNECGIAYANSTLPELPDFENVNDLLGEIAQEHC